jgi:spore photoproduct lyase
VKIKKLYIDQQVSELPETALIRSRLNVPAEIVQESQTVFNNVLNADDPIEAGKRILYLTRNRGAYIKSCPGTRSYLCCGYKILHIGSFCHMDCTYCILQSYFHPPVLQYFVNHDDLMHALRNQFEYEKIFRIGTGEFTDSLIWELWTDLSTQLVPAFADQEFCALELKTKTTAIDALKTLRHRKKTIMAWSLNTRRIIQNEERRTAALTSRLKAAATCASWGYPLAFHFDPMVIYEGCRKEYREVVRQLFDHIDPHHIVWISLGTLRFMPALKDTIQARFRNSRIIYGEFINGLDGKMRYFKPLRIKLYRNMVKWIRAFAPNVTVYLCMEDEEVWHKSMGFIPSDFGGLSKLLDESAIRLCELNSDGLLT